MAGCEENRKLRPFDRLLLAERTMARVRRNPKLRACADRLQVRLCMPGAREVDLVLYRAHVTELLARAKRQESLVAATEAEVLLLLERYPEPITERAQELIRALDRRLRGNEERPIPDRLLFDQLKHLARKRPRPVRRLKELLEEEAPCVVSNGQAA